MLTPKIPVRQPDSSVKDKEFRVAFDSAESSLSLWRGAILNSADFLARPLSGDG